MDWKKHEGTRQLLTQAGIKNHICIYCAVSRSLLLIGHVLVAKERSLDHFELALR